MGFPDNLNTVIQAVKTSDDPSTQIEALELWFATIRAVPLPLAPEYVEFLELGLLQVVYCTISRKYPADVAERVNSMLQLILDLAIHLIEHEPAVIKLMYYVLYPDVKFYTPSHAAERKPTIEDTEGEFVYAQMPENRQHTSQLYIDNVNHFGQRNGIDLLISRLESSDCTMRIMHDVVLLFSIVFPFFLDGLKDRVATALTANVFPRFLELPDSEFQNFGMKFAMVIHDTMLTIAKPVWGSDTATNCSRFLLSVALKLFSSQYVARRLEGLKMITHRLKTLAAMDERMEYDDAVGDETMSIEYALAWLGENHILESLFSNDRGPAIHDELLKHALPVVTFLAQYGSFQLENIDLIWNATIDQHEATRNAVYDIFRNIPGYLSLELSSYLFSKILRIPRDQIDEPTLSMVYGFTVCIAEEIDQSLPRFPFGIGLFFDIISDESSNIDGRIRERCAGLLVDVMYEKETKGRYLYVIKQLLIECIKMITEHKASLLAIKLLTYILRKNTATRKDQKSLAQEIETLEEEHKLTKVIVSDIVDYFAVCKSTGTMNPLAPTIGPFFHKDHLGHRLDSLLFLCTHAGDRVWITKECVNMLWDTIVHQNGALEGDLEYFIVWMKQCCETKNVFDEDVTKHIFLNMIPELNAEDLTVVEWEFYKLFMDVVNEDSGNLGHSKSVLVVQREIIDGIDILWKIATTAKNSEVSGHAIRKLIALYTASVAPTVDVENRQREFVSKCMAILKQASGVIVGRCLTLLKQYLAHHQQAPTQLPMVSHSASLERPTSITIKLTVLPNTNVTLTMNSRDVIGTIRKKAAETIPGVDATGIRLIFSGSELMPADDGISLVAAKIVDGSQMHATRRLSTQHVQPAKPIEKKRSRGATVMDAHPALLLSADECFNVFFKLLDRGEWTVWPLLMSLPTVPAWLAHLRELDRDWPDLFHPASSPKLLYALQITTSLCHESMDNEWSNSFIHRGGLAFLMHTFNTRGVEIITSDSSINIIELQCLHLLLQTINQLSLDKMDTEMVSGGLLHGDHDHLIKVLMQTVWVASGCSKSTGIKWSQLCDNTTVSLENLVVERASLKWYAGIVEEALRLMTAVLLRPDYATSTLSRLCDWPVFKQWIIGVITHGYQDCRAHLVEAIIILCYGEPKSHEYFLNLVLSFLESVSLFSPNSAEYFVAVDALLADSLASDQLTNLAKYMAECVKNHSILEIRKQCDCIDCLLNVGQADSELCGYLILLTTLVSHDLQLKLDIGDTLINEVFNDCLFKIPTQHDCGPHAPPKCKTGRSRETAFLLLVELCNNCPQNLSELLKLVTSQHRHRSDITTWHYSPSFYCRSPAGYVGLSNLGASCYMNSVLQQLFMHKEIRPGILGSKGDMELLREIQVVFGHLLESEKRFFEPRGFAAVYKDSDGQPIDVHQQMDADEFFTVLVDRLETLLKGQPQEELFKETFGLTVVNQVIGKDCGHVSEREDPQYVLSLDVKNKRNIVESLELFVEGETLSGDNQYHCDGCGKKVDAVKRACLGDLPSTLILHLKRFEFDLETVTRVKINDHYEFPILLNLDEFTKTGLQVMEQGGTVDDTVPQYELSGVLVHKGTVDSGHYYSYIKQKEKWIEFNDTVVEEFSAEDLDRLCFGGREQVQVMNQHTQRMEWRWQDVRHSAYLLFYERVGGREPIVYDSAPHDIIDRVWAENMSFFTDLQVFDTSNYNFIIKLLGTGDKSRPLLDLGIEFFVNTLSHSGNKASLPQLTDVLDGYFKNSVPAADHFIHRVCGGGVKSWLQQLLLSCTIPDARAAFQRLIMTSVKSVLPLERAEYYEDGIIEISDSDHPSIVVLIRSLMSLLDIAPLHWQHFSHFLALILDMCMLGPEERALLLSMNVTTDLLDFFLWDDSGMMSTDTDSVPSRTQRMGDKNKVAQLGDVVSAIDMLVRSCVSPCGRPAEELDDEGKLDSQTTSILSQKAFYKKALSEGQNGQALGSIARHMQYENIELSSMLIEASLECIEEEPRQYTQCLAFLGTLIMEEDSHHMTRLDKMLESFVNLVLHNLRRPALVYHCIQFLANEVTKLPSGRAWLRHHLLQYFEAWGMAHFDYNVRAVTEVLVQNLVDPSFSESMPEPIIGGPALPELESNSDAEPTEKNKELQQVYMALLVLLPNARKYTNVVKTGTENADNMHHGYRLVQYFRLLRMCLRSLEDRLQLVLHFDLFRTLFDQVDQHRFEMDQNKKELMDFWCVALEGCPRLVLQHVTNDPHLVSRLMDFYISLRGGSQRYLKYNQEALPSFYRCIFLCAAQNSLFLSKLIRHRNWLWAVQFLIIDTCEYDSVSPAVFDTLALCCASNPVFVTDVIDVLVQNIFKLSHNTANLTKVMTLCLTTKKNWIAFAHQSGLESLTDYISEHAKFDGSLSDSQDDMASVLKLLNTCVSLFEPDEITIGSSVVGTKLIWSQASIEKLIDSMLVLIRKDAPPDARDQSFELLLRVSSIHTSFLQAVVQYLYRAHRDSQSVQDKVMVDDQIVGYHTFLAKLCKLALDGDVADSVDLALYGLYESLNDIGDIIIAATLLPYVEKFPATKLLLQVVDEVLKTRVLLLVEEIKRFTSLAFTVLRNGGLVDDEAGRKYANEVVAALKTVDTPTEKKAAECAASVLFTDPAIRAMYPDYNHLFSVE